MKNLNAQSAKFHLTGSFTFTPQQKFVLDIGSE